MTDILEVSPTDIITQQSAIVNFSAKPRYAASFGYVENYDANQKELLKMIGKGC